MDVVTLESRIKTIIDSGVRKKTELETINKEIDDIGEIDYSEDDYRKMRSENEALISKMAEERSAINMLKNTNKALANAEYCPTCHRKLDNVDNSAQIKKNEEEIQNHINNGVEMKKKSDEIIANMNSIEGKRTLSQKKSQLQLKASAINVELANLRNEGTEKKNLLKEITKNKEAIDKNAQIDAQLNVINANIKNEENIKREANSNINLSNMEITKNNETIAQKKSYIIKIEDEQKVEKYWKLYLQMIGKDGISKMVLRNTLPIINSELKRLLGDVTDFDVEVVMDDKNDVDFLMIRDGVVTRLAAASGLETTQAALALRVVLGKMSRLSRPPFILLDEVLGTVAKENYDDMKKLYDKIVEYYDFVLHICHIDLDWYDGNIVTVVKNNNISSIKE